VLSLQAVKDVIMPELPEVETPLHPYCKRDFVLYLQVRISRGKQLKEEY